MVSFPCGPNDPRLLIALCSPLPLKLDWPVTSSIKCGGNDVLEPVSPGTKKGLEASAFAFWGNGTL